MNLEDLLQAGYVTARFGQIVGQRLTELRQLGSRTLKALGPGSLNTRPNSGSVRRGPAR